MSLLGSEQAGIGSTPTAAGPDSPGINPPETIPTLAEVYAAGAGDVQADDVFAMPSGNLRFLGDAGANGVPGTAWYESATTSGDSRLAAWYTRRYLRTGTGVGQTIGDALVGFDPAWDGTFGRLDGIKLTAARAGYTAVDDQTSAGAGTVLGDASFQSVSGFFDGPVCFPTPGLNAGSVELFVLDLYQGSDNALRTAIAFSGWGQISSVPLPLQHGITAAFDIRADWSKMTPEADDGIGIMFRRSTDDPPCAMLDAHMLAANAAGDYGLGFWARSAGTLSEIATFDWTNGIVFNALVTSTDPQYSVYEYQASGIDMLTPGFYGFTIPSAPAGKTFVPLILRIYVDTQTGAATGGGMIAFSQGGADISTTSSFTAATWNPTIGAPYSIPLGTTIRPITALDSAGLQFHVITGVTGPTVMTARLVAVGVFI